MAGIDARYQGIRLDTTVHDRINAKDPDTGEYTHEATRARQLIEENELFSDLLAEIEDREELTRKLGDSYDRIAGILKDIRNAPRASTHGKGYTAVAQTLTGRTGQGVADWSKNALTEDRA